MKADSELIKWLLGESGVSMYQIWKDTGIPQTTLSDLTTGKTLIENMFFNRAAKLTEYAQIIKDGGEIKMTKLTGIKKAVGEYNNWQGHAEIMLDTATGEIWCNVYAGPNEFTRYDNQDTKRLISKANTSMWERDDKTTMREVEERAKVLIKVK